MSPPVTRSADEVFEVIAKIESSPMEQLRFWLVFGFRNSPLKRSVAENGLRNHPPLAVSTNLPLSTELEVPAEA